MGLDACVFCDCLEKGRNLKPLPNDVVIKVGADGYASVERNGEEVWEDLECEHQFRFLIRHRLGNIALVGFLRWELNREASSYPFLLKRVVYSGSHTGDWIGLDQLPELQAELQRLATFKCAGNAPKSFDWSRLLPNVFPFDLWRQNYSTAAESDRFMQTFRSQMLELIEVAKRAGKPISF